MKTKTTNKQIKLNFKISAMALLFLAIAFFAFTLQANSVSAVSANDWRAGNIIDDGTFYNNASMTVGEIQNFLESKVPVCDTYGTQKHASYPNMTNAQYAASRGLPAPPYVCLKDYMQVPRSDTIVDNFSGTVPAGAISAAQIIKNAADAYAVSPKTLLVLLQKESPGPLPIDSWPFQSQYRNAMGYACPDTAPCDPKFAGFYNQVTNAAMRIQTYKNYPTSYRHQANRTNSVLYNPNYACGATDVYIESKATAGLYNYTPYQPNQAALNNLYGSGDGCSAYGNRNFWRIYNDWFSKNAYDWNVTDQAIYLDAAHTRRLDYSPTLQPGVKYYAQITAVNTGTATWNQMTRLATNSPAGRTSVFYDASDWLSPNRPATPAEGGVAPGATGTFNFTLQVPRGSLRSYTEQFNLVQDGVTSFPSRGQNFVIDVADPVTSNRLVTRSFGTGSSLKAGESIISSDGNTALNLRDDGNLVLLRDFSVAWETKTSGNPNSMLFLQSDGNLVLYSKNMVPIWNSGTPGTTSNSLNLQADANLVLYGNTGPTWSSGTNTPQMRNEVVNPRMPSGGILLPGQRIETADRSRTLILQGDGNLVLYGRSFRPLWSTQTDGKPTKFLAMQTDGNLVLYSMSNTPLWNSGTAGSGSSRLFLQDDTNLVIYKDSGQATWATYTIQ